MGEKIRFDVAAAILKQKYLPANCWELGRFKPLTESITLSLNQGPNPMRPWEPHVLVGSYRVHRSVSRGCLYVRQDAGSASVRRATVKKVEREGKSSYYMLHDGGEGELTFSLIKVDLALPNHGRILIHGDPAAQADRELHIHHGVRGGTLVAEDGTEALVMVGDGEEVQCFFLDGQVRSFLQVGENLSEKNMSHEDMLDCRIVDAKERLLVARHIEDPERRMKRVRHILSGMADLLQLTSRFRGVGQVMRITLLREFFTELPKDELELVHKKLWAILSSVDSTLRQMLTAKAKPSVDLTSLGEKFRVTSERKSSKTEQEQKRAARASADAALRAQMKGKGGSKPSQHTTDPKKLARMARLAAKNKKK